MNSSALVEEIKACMSALDMSNLIAKFTSNGTMRIGNIPAANGHAEMEKLCEPFKAHMSSVTFSDSTVEDTPNSIVWQAKATFYRKDGIVISHLFCAIIHREGDLIKDYLEYTDPTGLLPEEPHA